jgi:hypothetical protein
MPSCHRLHCHHNSIHHDIVIPCHHAITKKDIAGFHDITAKNLGGRTPAATVGFALRKLGTRHEAQADRPLPRLANGQSKPKTPFSLIPVRNPRKPPENFFLDGKNFRGYWYTVSPLSGWNHQTGWLSPNTLDADRNHRRDSTSSRPRRLKCGGSNPDQASLAVGPTRFKQQRQTCFLDTGLEK